MNSIPNAPGPNAPEPSASVPSPAPERLIIFARYPEPGRAKTRLIPALGADAAARLQQRLTSHMINLAAQLRCRRLLAVEIQFTGSTTEQMQQLYHSHSASAANIVFRPQCDGDLGHRLHTAAAAAFQSGSAKVVMIGTDCPDITVEFLETAFHALETDDVIIGPAADGGYTLIGMNRMHSALFADIEWSSERVFGQTIQRAAAMNLRISQLPKLSDVDCAEDLVVCRRQPSVFDGILPSIRKGCLSIVIPAVNEADQISRTLAPIQNRFTEKQTDIEVILADGGSTDDTVRIAQQSGARVICTGRGRGRQMNAGAALSCGEVMLFLHADTQLPPDFEQTVWKVLNGGAIAGAFQLQIDSPSLGLRLIEWGANLRSRIRQLPYGDQALFVRADDFFRLGGFRHWPLMEDYEFCRRLARHGRITLAETAVKTSDRRWKKMGILQTTLKNQCCVAAYHLGVPIERLAAFYKGRSTANSDSNPISNTDQIQSGAGSQFLPEGIAEAHAEPVEYPER